MLCFWHALFVQLPLISHNHPRCHFFSVFPLLTPRDSSPITSCAAEKFSPNALNRTPEPAIVFLTYICGHLLHLSHLYWCIILYIFQ